MYNQTTKNMQYIKFVLIAGYIGIGILFIAPPIIDILKTVFEYVPAVSALIMILVSAVYFVGYGWKLNKLKHDKSGKAIDEERDATVKRYIWYLIGIAVQIGALIYAYNFYMSSMKLTLF